MPLLEQCVVGLWFILKWTVNENYKHSGSDTGTNIIQEISHLSVARVQRKADDDSFICRLVQQNSRARPKVPVQAQSQGIKMTRSHMVQVLMDL